MKQKRKLKNGYRISNKRFLVVAIGLVVILTLAIANIAYMANYRMNVGQTATVEAMWEYELTSYATVYYPYTNLFDAQTATLVQIQIQIAATQTAEAR